MSDESPPVVDLSLTNTGDHTASVYPREPGSYVFHLVPPFLNEGGEVFLLPQNARTIQLQQGELDKTGGCYRVIDTSEEDERGPYLAGQALAKEIEIEPSERYSVRHHAYFHGPESECFPTGEYQTSLGIELRDGENTHVFNLIYTLEISPEKDLAISVEADRDPPETQVESGTREYLLSTL